MEDKERELATERGTHVVEEAILLEMEKNARSQVGLLLVQPKRVRQTSACVRRLAKRVQSLSRDGQGKHALDKSSKTLLFTVFERDISINEDARLSGLAH